jgi:hypothetical protein
VSSWSVDNYKWVEVWIEESTPYFLMLGSKSESELEVFDPKEDKVVHSAASYEAARNWLNEDEFTRVDGRIDVRAMQ